MNLDASPQLRRLIAEENYRELLTSLTPKQLAVVALVLDGCDLVQAGEVLGLAPGCARERMVLARQQLRVKRPDIQPGNRRPTRRGDRWKYHTEKP